MDLTLSIIEKYKGKLKLGDESDFPRDLLCLWNDITVYDKNKINIPGLTELSRVFNVVIAGEYASFVCGLNDFFRRKELMAVVPAGTDVRKIVREIGFGCISHRVFAGGIDKPYFDIPRLTVESGAVHEVRILGQKLSCVAAKVKDGGTTTTVAVNSKLPSSTLWVWEVESRDTVEKLYKNPLAYVNHCVQHYGLEIHRCAGVLDKTESKYVFFKLGEKCPDFFEADRKEPFTLMFEYKHAVLRTFDEGALQKLKTGQHEYSMILKNIHKYIQNTEKQHEKYVYNNTLLKLIEAFDNATLSHSKVKPLSRSSCALLEKRLYDTKKSELKLKQILKYREENRPEIGGRTQYFLGTSE